MLHVSLLLLLFGVVWCWYITCCSSYFFSLSLISDLADDAARTAHMQPKAEGICSRTGLFVSKEKWLNFFFFLKKKKRRGWNGLGRSCWIFVATHMGMALMRQYCLNLLSLAPLFFLLSIKTDVSVLLDNFPRLVFSPLVLWKENKKKLVQRLVYLRSSPISTLWPARPTLSSGCYYRFNFIDFFLIISRLN